MEFILFLFLVITILVFCLGYLIGTINELKRRK
jgi:hypothetical protein